MYNLSHDKDTAAFMAIKQIGNTTEPSDAALKIHLGMYPRNFVELTKETQSFKDATLNFILKSFGPNDDRVTLINSFVTAVKGSVHPREREAYSEYLGILSYAWGMKELAIQAILSIEPANASSFVKSTANAISKEMPFDVYENLVLSSTQTSTALWSNVEKEIKFPNL